MGKRFADPTRPVELRLPTGMLARIPADALNIEHAAQNAAYAAEATRGADGILRGPTGRRRTTNRIRNLRIDDLVADPTALAT